MDDFSRFRSGFPALRQYTYLNTAAWGLMHEDLQEWRQDHDLEFLIGGSVMKMAALPLLEHTRERLGRFFGCDPGRIALSPNFSLGLNLLLEGLDSSSRVLLLEGDYPSLNWPFESRGFPISRIPLAADLEARIETALEAGPVEVLALSLVQWLNGILVRPEFLRGLKEKYPELLIIADATQYAGAFALDFEASGIDVLGASGYKWLLGGNGNGFFLFSPRAEERIVVRSHGFNAAGADPDRKEGIPFARRLEPGHLDTLCFGSLGFALEQLERLGMDRVDRYNRDLSARVKQALASLSLLDAQVLGRQDHSTIFNIPEPGGRYRYLKEHGVVCAPRGGGIRVSFHCYNSENDLDKLVELIKKAP
ncbi:aminotransferase class V-fold PLP-dependent enzyme [Robiginitalea marina]|uniref:Aminotransferase class V-fold PLP-dependent enzyme n=1 Tax=Robiginitalea marina TaxID=2954105 RepID=A0ABT1AYJ8_9FLAO|nr:aminotransferase class V-fold PLP-dependent enzyme [Robiginitalea marina]MCO5724692.1 aminotransferase class V-fold PLP-dependent enzyme [Robiginitalea marina]